MTRQLTGRVFLMAFSLTCTVSCSSRTAQVDGGATAGYTKIDDMEGERHSIEWTPPSGLLPGWWYASTDCSTEGNISPPPDTVVAGAFVPSEWSYSVLPAAHETFPGIVSTHAARLRTTTPLQGVWGANMAFAFAWPSGDASAQVIPSAVSDAGAPTSDASASGPTTCPIIYGSEAAVDLSTYSGITFWAKGDPAGERTVQIMFQDVHTDPRGGFCNYIDSSSPDFCYNGFGTGIALTDTFAQYTIDFRSLQQNPHWGYRPDPDVFDPQHVYQLVFQITAPACYTNEKCVGGSAPAVSFDFWIDDLYFVNM
jgi:hypothetical protein